MLFSSYYQTSVPRPFIQLFPKHFSTNAGVVPPGTERRQPVMEDILVRERDEQWTLGFSAPLFSAILSRTQWRTQCRVPAEHTVGPGSASHTAKKQRQSQRHSCVSYSDNKMFIFKGFFLFLSLFSEMRSLTVLSKLVLTLGFRGYSRCFLFIHLLNTGYLLYMNYNRKQGSSTNRADQK